MIGFLRGTVFAIGLDYILLDVNNVGYRINFVNRNLKIGQEALIYTYQNVKEDEISLFGFSTLAEYDMFVKLLSVKGLGPKTSMNILAVSSVDAIVNAIEQDDVAFMKRMPGVGAKTASQIILDLKGKLVSKQTENSSVDRSELKAALKSLGYKQIEIDSVVAKLSDDDTDLSSTLRKALAMLAK
ncbi:MAG: Holliday junction branch migration protein RuvA [Erysipelotrichaceae bacterium]|nr:Holliday junction branch migration protein RuvA [Erysipelotrichaceae bacterium]